MAGAIVLYDHIAPVSVFSRKAAINVKACVLTLKKEYPGEQPLLGAIQYSSRNYRDAPSSLQALFA
jgi:hypothetical protein